MAMWHDRINQISQPIRNPWIKHIISTWDYHCQSFVCCCSRVPCCMSLLWMDRTKTRINMKKLHFIACHGITPDWATLLGAPVQLLVNSNIELANHMAATQRSRQSAEASEWRRKVIQVTLNVAWLLMPNSMVWEFQRLLIYQDFHSWPSLGFTEKGTEGKYSVSWVLFCQNWKLRLHSK